MRDNRISMPASTAGITRYFDEYKSKFTFKAGHVIILAIVIMVVVILMHMYGNSLLGIQ
jgi:preprotein translocase subunit Sec61beta